MQTELVMYDQSKFPTVSVYLSNSLINYLFVQSLDSWEIHTTKRKILYEVKEMNVGEIFGL